MILNMDYYSIFTELSLKDDLVKQIGSVVECILDSREWGEAASQRAKSQWNLESLAGRRTLKTAPPYL